MPRDPEVLTALWLSLMTLILALNVPVLLVFYATQQLRSPRILYIASILLSDILLAFVIPFKVAILQSRQPERTLCQVTHYVQSVMVSVNIYSVLMLALARHKYIFQCPVSRDKSHREAVFNLSYVWLASFISSIKVSRHFSRSEPFPNSSVFSYHEHSHCLQPHTVMTSLFGHDFLVDLVLPFSAIFFLCGHAYISIQHRRIREVDGAARKKRDSMVVRLVHVLACWFVILHLPRHIVDIVMQLEHFTRDSIYYVQEAAHLLTFSTGASNVIIYVTFNRSAARALVCFMTNKGMDEKWEVWMISAVWLMLMVIILLLNVPVLYLFYTTHQLKSTRNMYLASILVSDILMALTIPLRIWVLQYGAGPHSTLCRMTHYTQLATVSINTYSILLLVLARHKGIFHMSRMEQINKEAFLNLIYVWVACMACSARIPYVMNAYLDTVHDPPDLYQSNYKCFNHNRSMLSLKGNELLVDFLIPFGVILALCYHASIFIQNLPVREVEAAVRKMRDNQLVHLVLVLVLCSIGLHMPRHVLDLFMIIRKPTHSSLCYIYEAAYFLVYMTGASNVIIYVSYNRQSAEALFSFMKDNRGSITEGETSYSYLMSTLWLMPSRMRSSLSRLPSLFFTPSFETTTTTNTYHTTSSRNF